MKFLNGSSGLCGCSAERPCPWCMALSTDFSKSKEEINLRLRETKVQIMLSHSVVPGVVEAGYKCPACNALIQEDKAFP